MLQIYSRSFLLTEIKFCCFINKYLELSWSLATDPQGVNTFFSFFFRVMFQVKIKILLGQRGALTCWQSWIRVSAGRSCVRERSAICLRACARREFLPIDASEQFLVCKEMRIFISLCTIRVWLIESLLVNKLCQSNVSDARSFVAEKVNVGIQDCGVDGSIVLAQNWNEEKKSFSLCNWHLSECVKGSPFSK